MEKTKAQEAIKRLDKLTLRSDRNPRPLMKNSQAYKFVLKALQTGQTKIRPVYTSGSGRFISNQDHTQAVCSILQKIGIEFTLTNDSQRGGLTGNLITITN